MRHRWQHCSRRGGYVKLYRDRSGSRPLVSGMREGYTAGAGQRKSRVPLFFGLWADTLTLILIPLLFDLRPCLAVPAGHELLLGGSYRVLSYLSSVYKVCIPGQMLYFHSSGKPFL